MADNKDALNQCMSAERPTGVANDLNDIALRDGAYLVVGNNAMVLRSKFQAPQPPVILPKSIGQYDGGGFYFTVQSAPYTVPAIEASDDLLNWTVVSLSHVAPNSTGRLTFSDFNVTNQVRRFFRPSGNCRRRRT